MDNFIEVLRRIPGQEIPCTDFVGCLKCPDGCKEHQNTFLLISVSSKKQLDGTWLTCEVYTCNLTGWDEDIYPQAYPVLSFWERVKKVWGLWFG